MYIYIYVYVYRHLVDLGGLLVLAHLDHKGSDSTAGLKTRNQLSRGKRHARVRSAGGGAGLLIRKHDHFPPAGEMGRDVRASLLLLYYYSRPGVE